MTVDYFLTVQATMGTASVDNAVKFIMVPGLWHCGGGDGPNQFDMIAALEEWREKGKTPTQILASKVSDGHVVRTRPLCPFPQVAKYKGTGSIDRAESFACSAP
jgi:feruloyl esterase